MTYQNLVKSGTCWFTQKEQISASGTRLDIIYGVAQIGSPHNHLVSFEGKEEYHRRTQKSLKLLKTSLEEKGIIIIDFT